MMKKYIFLLMIFPLAVSAQEKTTVVLPTDIYHEYVIGSKIPDATQKADIQFYCGRLRVTMPQGPVRLRISCGTKESQEKLSPLYVVNGCVIENFKHAEIDPNNIETINVEKGEAAMKKYGGQAKNGVILITLKNKSTNPITKVEVAKPTLRL